MKYNQIIKFTVLLFALMISTNHAFAQQISVSGVVISAEDGELVLGATIFVKDSQNGTITDFDGRFSIQADKNDVLLVSYVGMETQELAPAASMQITLRSASLEIDEVLVVAYGTATKKSFTGSATNIKGDDLSKKNPTEISKSLAGEIAGVQVISGSGQPGSSATIRIRGLGSINSGKGPLYVIDGIPFSGDISSINPADIETTTILKDATATALYGSRGSNGVILISTKKGKAGVSQIEAEVKYGVNMRLIPMCDVLDNPEQYVELSWESLRNRKIYADLMSNDAAGKMNWHQDMLNRWNEVGQQTAVPRLSSTYDNNVNNVSSRFITSSSYLNLANLRLAYNFPKQLLSSAKIGSLTAYITADNLFVLSARNDELGKAETYLKTLLNERDPEFASTLNGKSKNELLDLIYHNWRVEMWGEGRGLMTMKRFKKSIKRANNHYAHQGETISYDDPRMTFEIPEVEIVNNPDIAK